MSTNKTKNLKLHSWVRSDPFNMDEFNENFDKLDQTVGEHTSELARVDAEAAHVVFGTYDGDGNNTQNIELGFKPKAVLVLRQDGTAGNVNSTYGGLALPGQPVTRGGSQVAVTITDTGFRVAYVSGWVFANSSGFTYYYLAFR